MKFRKKMMTILLTAISMMILVIPVMAKPQSITVSFNQAQFQWRATDEFGDWSYIDLITEVNEDYKLSGTVLHTSWSYSPEVTELTGTSTVYVYNKKVDLWIEREGQVTYKYVLGYGDYTIVNFFRGYLDFGGEAPSDESFVHGVAYQWAYIYASEDDTEVKVKSPNAQWDSKVGAWLVGFSIYL